jgi:hypothetical protein
LAAVEEAPPIDVVDELAEMVDAGHVSLLIAYFSGSVWCGTGGPR